MTAQPSRERTTDRRVGALLLLGLVVLFGGLYAAAYLFTGDKIPRGTTVADVEVGGMMPRAARAKLNDELASRATEPMTVRGGGHRVQLDPAKAGLRVDYDQSVMQAGGGRSWNPARMWDYVAGGDDFEPVLAVDEAALDKSLAGFAGKVDRKAKEGGLRFEKGRAEPTFPRTGRSVNRDATAEAVTQAFLDPGVDVVEAVVDQVQPDVGANKVRRVLNDFGNPAMSAPVVLTLKGRDIVLRPRDFDDVLSVKAQNRTLVPALAKERLLTLVRKRVRRLPLGAKPATVRLKDGKPRVVKGETGVSFDGSRVSDQFLSLVVQRGDNRTMALKPVTVKPDFTKADARKLGIKEVVSSFSTSYPHSDYRNTNLGRAAQKVNGTVLRPGETFSLNGTVGERTAENGFTKGFIISNGVYKEDFGGGVSQVATTLFNAAFFAGLEDVEHKPHSFYIDRYPIGREATVAWGAVDLRFKNDTEHGVLIQSWIDPSSPSTSGSMNVRLWSTKTWDITTDTSDRYDLTQEETRYIQDEECVPNDGYGGFDIDVYRYFRRPGSDELVRKETFHTTYTPSDTVVCGKDPNA